MNRDVVFSVNKKDKWSDVCLFFYSNKQAMQELRAKIPTIASGFNFDLLSVRGMLQGLHGMIPDEVKAVMQTKDVKGAIEWLNAYEVGLQIFTEFLEATEPQVTAKERNLLAGLAKTNVEEYVLWTLKECYNLQGFEDAHKLTVYEYKTARKNIYNDSVIRAKINKL